MRGKPGPKPRVRPVENVDYYCGGCAGHRVIACPECVGGCLDCRQKGFVRCPTCKGGAVPQPPPVSEWDR